MTTNSTTRPSGESALKLEVETLRANRDMLEQTEKRQRAELDGYDGQLFCTERALGLEVAPKGVTHTDRLQLIYIATSLLRKECNELGRDCGMLERVIEELEGGVSQLGQFKQLGEQIDMLEVEGCAKDESIAFWMQQSMDFDQKLDAVQRELGAWKILFGERTRQALAVLEAWGK